jgi:hypothetical protein
VKALAAFEARETRFLAPLHPAEERLVGPVKARQHVLQHVAVDGSVVRQLGADGLE